MGEVYRARDTRLGRDVAIKVLPADVAKAADRLTRFRREAHLLAALNHPNIAAIYGLDQEGETLFLVLELAEGEDLAVRLKRGPLDFGVAAIIGRQIAAALEEAHEKGIVHRDLKPENIKVTPDGRIKVLDFGLAQAYGLDPETEEASISSAPTVTSDRVGAGLILGTAGYMSPEQARGLPTDKRTDIWAFGVVVFEMLTGKRLFSGVNLPDTLASVLTGEIPWDTLPHDLPESHRRLLRRCLERDRALRLRDIGEARILLDAEAGGALNGAPFGSGSRRQHGRFLPWIAAGLATMVALAAWLPWSRSEEARVVRLKAGIGADVSLGPGADLALSPDGGMLAFVGESSGGPGELYVRRLDQLTATPLPGTQDASDPFFSPGGDWIGFFADRKLKKVPAGGGAVVTLCDAPDNRGGTWTARDVIVFGTGERGLPLQRVDAQGGTPLPLGPLAPGEVTQGWPQALPDGTTLLYTSHRAGQGTFDAADIMATRIEGGSSTLIAHGGFHARYATSGHLLFIRGGRLLAAPFRLGGLTLGGEPEALTDDVANDVTTGAAQYALSDLGTLVYGPQRPAAAAERPVFWLDASGRTAPLRQTPSDWSTPRFAPGGHALAFSIKEGGQSDIWSYEWDRDVLTKLTFDTGHETHPVWTPDGAGMVFAGWRESGESNLYYQSLDGKGAPQRLTESPNPQLPYSFHQGGRFLAYTERRASSKEDILILPIEPRGPGGIRIGRPLTFLSTPASESEPMFSPDGRWIAYSSNESGRSEVYVRGFPGNEGPWRISQTGGASPRWSATRSEILFVEKGALTRIMSATFLVEKNQFRPAPAVPWSQRGVTVDEDYELHPDGRRIATGPTERAMPAAGDHVVILLNLKAELERVAPRRR